jgi:hypothetical protein
LVAASDCEVRLAKATKAHMAASTRHTMIVAVRRFIGATRHRSIEREMSLPGDHTATKASPPHSPAAGSVMKSELPRRDNADSPCSLFGKCR